MDTLKEKKNVTIDQLNYKGRLMFQILERQTRTEMHRSWAAFLQIHWMTVAEVKAASFRVRLAFVEESTNRPMT